MAKSEDYGSGEKYREPSSSSLFLTTKFLPCQTCCRQLGRRSSGNASSEKQVRTSLALVGGHQSQQTVPAGASAGRLFPGEHGGI